MPSLHSMLNFHLMKLDILQKNVFKFLLNVFSIYDVKYTFDIILLNKVKKLSCKLFTKQRVIFLVL